MGAGAGAGVAASAGAVGGTSAAGSIFTLGAGALATKAVAGLAAAAIVTAGAVAADHVSHLVRHHHPAATAAAYMPATASASEPVVVVRNRPQPISSSSRAYKPSGGAAIARHHARRHPAKPRAHHRRLPASSTVHVNPVVATTKPATIPQPPAATQVTEVTTETAQLPVAATSEAQPTTPSTPTTTTATTTTLERNSTVVSPPSATEPERSHHDAGHAADRRPRIYGHLRANDPPARNAAPSHAACGNNPGNPRRLAEGERLQRRMQDARGRDFQGRSCCESTFGEVSITMSTPSRAPDRSGKSRTSRPYIVCPLTVAV